MVEAVSQRLSVPRRLLYGPGPSAVDPRAYEAMTQPVLGIRDSYFLQIINEIRDGLRLVFGTKNHMTLPISGSGSAAMETAVANFIEPGTKVAVFTAGYFGDRISNMAERHGAQVARCAKAPGSVFSAEEAEEFLDRERPAVVTFVQAETSTGAYQSGRNIVPAARKHGALVIADTVTSLGAMPVELDDIGIDVAFSCSQKGLSCPAGLSPISISPRAWDRLQQRKSTPVSWYLDLKLLEQYFEPPHAYHHTPSPPLFYAMHQGLAVIAEEGLSERWRRHEKANERLVTGLKRLGFQPFVERPSDRLWHLTTVTPPAGLAEAEFRQRLLQNFDIEIASGLGTLAGKIFRVGTMGPLATDENVDYLLNAFERSL
jgi:alanine-glyoxylate transaminase / serine-glyoxylate transaminase / serine-pyruvate transaminase